jgi:hypothetical protein
MKYLSRRFPFVICCWKRWRDILAALERWWHNNEMTQDGVVFFTPWTRRGWDPGSEARCPWLRQCAPPEVAEGTYQQKNWLNTGKFSGSWYACYRFLDPDPEGVKPGEIWMWKRRKPSEKYKNKMVYFYLTVKVLNLGLDLDTDPHITNADTNP